jgi:hypothetical protein
MKSAARGGLEGGATHRRRQRFSQRRRIVDGTHRISSSDVSRGIDAAA